MIYAIGASALTGGAADALDAEYASAIADKYPAFVCVPGDKIYHYIADADSGADESSPDVIKPDWESVGVPYTGALRWILHNTYGVDQPFTSAEKSKLGGIKSNADVTDAGNVASVIHGAAGKATPVDADEVGLIDSAAANALKKLTWANIKATLKTYFDTLYNNYTLENHASNHTDGTDDIQNATATQKGLATAAQIAKLDGIANNATADQSQADMGIYGGSGTFAGATGATVSIGVTLGGTSYRVSITPTGDALNVGSIYVDSKTTTNFKVKCTGSGTPTFDWILIDQN